MSYTCQYTIRTGDTLQSIANIYGTSPASIFAANTNSVIQNQLLQSPIPVGLTIMVPSTFPCNGNGNNGCTLCDGTNTSTDCTYFVMPNDTYTSIAALLNSFSTINDITPLQLAQFNGSSNVNQVLTVGTEIRIPNCTVTNTNNCAQLLADVELFLCKAGYPSAQVSIGFAQLDQGALYVPVLVVTGINSNVVLFTPPIPNNTYLTPLDQSRYTTEAPLPINSRLYSLESVQDYMSIRHNNRYYTCAGSMSQRSSVQRSDCTSVYVLFSQYNGTTNLSTIGARANNIVLRVTRASGIQTPAWLQGMINNGTAVLRSNPSSTTFPMGSVTVFVDYTAFTTFMAAEGISVCESEGGVIPDDENCDDILDRVTPIIERSVGSNAGPFTVSFGAVRGRGPNIDDYNPSQFIVPVIVVIGHANIVPFDGKQVAGACLLPLSQDNYTLVSPQLTTTQLSNTSIFDLASVIAFLATDTSFSSRCASALSKLYNQQCLNIVEALEDEEYFDATAGTRPGMLSARFEGISVRRVVNADTVIPAWILTAGGTVTERRVEGSVLNKTILIPVPNLIKYRQLGGQANCTFMFNQSNTYYNFNAPVTTTGNVGGRQVTCETSTDSNGSSSYFCYVTNM